jgi:hypothetical protein
MIRKSRPLGKTLPEPARGMEQFFRRVLFRWKYFQADMVVEPVYYVGKTYIDSGFGLAVKEETLATVEACQENGCPCEFVLKDISTVGGRPQNLIDWTRTVMAVLDRFYR